MSRPMVLAFLLMVLIITSQFEWKQQLVSEIEPNASIAGDKQERISRREELVKEKIILSQEKSIQRLNELVRNLRKQLVQCKGDNVTIHGTPQLLTENVNELERQQILDD